jgi:hypothetical protein
MRTLWGRRIRALRDGYAARLGGWEALDHVTADAVRRAAELTVLAEKLRHDALRDCNVDPYVLARLENSASRAVRELMLDHPRDKPKPQTLDQWMAEFQVPSGQARTAPRPPAGGTGPGAAQERPAGRTPATIPPKPKPAPVRLPQPVAGKKPAPTRSGTKLAAGLGTKSRSAKRRETG